MSSALSALSFFVPTNVISAVVVMVLVILGIFFLQCWWRSSNELVQARKLLDLLSSDEAIGILEAGARWQRQSDQANYERGFSAVMLRILSGPPLDEGEWPDNADEWLHVSSPAYDKVKQNAVLKHLKSIFIAGCQEWRLETEALMRHTQNQLFRETFRLKNILSSFIIIGLFGTLIGLSDSLSGLSPVLNFQGPEKNLDIATSLAGLLLHLKSAFAPSLWGILFTMVGMALYVRFVHHHCTPLQIKLENLTLNTWVPRLYPSVSYQLVEALTDNTNRFVEHVKDAAAVAGFAREVRECTGDFRDNMLDGITLLRGLESHIALFKSAAEQIDETFARKLCDFSDRFETTVDKLTGFQDQLLELQGHLSSSATEFNVSMRNAVEFQNVRIEGLHGNMLKVLESLKMSEATYIENILLHVDESKKLVTAVRKSKDSDSEINRDIAKSILETSSERFQAIEGEMRESFTSLIRRLDDNLRQLQSNFDSYDTPIRKAAVKIEATAENIDNYHQALKKSLIQNNDELMKQLRTLAEVTKENNDQFLKKLLERDADASKQSDDVQNLISAITNLSQSLNKPIWHKLNPFSFTRGA